LALSSQKTMKKYYLILVTLTLFGLCPLISFAQYTKLHDFNIVPDGRNPHGSLISDGTSLYGMTYQGGINNLGTIFKIMPDGSGYTKLLDFDGTTTGSHPWGSLFFDGNFLYGMTEEGGTNTLGVIFKIMRDGTGFVKLFDFAASNGYGPRGSLISDGTFLYGIASPGGANNKGTIFKIKPDGTGFVKVLDFAGGANGSTPVGDLLSDGTFLYGMTYEGGVSNLGTIYKIKLDGTGFVKLLDFAGAVNGYYPKGSLITDGMFLYGMTYSGGADDSGTIFKIMFDGTGYQKLLDFVNVTNGRHPQGSLIFDGAFLYGMTQNGGINDKGSIFEIKADGTGFSKLLDFSFAANGALPWGSLISDGTFLYGMTEDGGVNAIGTIFKFSPSNPVPTITSFAPASGPVGATVTITGTNFSTTPANNIVYFGATRATVTAATSTQLTVTVPVGSTYEAITVQVSGLTARSAKRFTVTFAGGGSIDECSFSSSVIVTGIPGFTRPALADIDGDGKSDLLIPESTNNLLSIFRNISVAGSITSASFETKLTFATVNTPFSVAVGDLDGDGKRDLAVINYRGSKISIYKNLSTPGAILLASKVDFAIPDFAHDVSIADIDGDGKQDLTITTSLVGLTVLRNTGTPGVINATTFATGIDFATGPNPSPFVLGDIDGDGKLDAAVPNANAYSVSLLLNTSTPGTISFATQVVLTTAAGSPAAGGGTVFIVLGDIDGDSKLDLVVTNNTVMTNSIYRNTSTIGVFSFDPKFDLPNIANTNTPSLGDLDGDGKIDLITDYGSAYTSSGIYKNVGTPGVINATSFNAPVVVNRQSSGSLLNGDVDGDGRNDIITTSASIQVFRNLIGTIATPTITSLSPSIALIGTTITINGSNFNTLFSTSVEFNGVSAPIIDITPGTITVNVPVGATTGPIEVTIGCNSVISSSNFTVASPVTITVTKQPVFTYACEGSTATLITDATGTTNITYKWQKFDGSDFTDINDGIGYSGTTTKSLNINTTVTGFGGNGQYQCRINGDGAPEVISNAAQLTINGLPSPPDVVSTSSCGPGSITLTASGGSPGNYQWYTTSPLTLISGETNETYTTPTLSASTQYAVTVKDIFCASLPVNITAVINPLPTKPIVTSSIVAVANALTICSTTTLTLSAPIGFSDYLWSDGSITPQISVTTAGTYSVVVKDSQGCSSSASDGLTVTIVQAPCNNSAPVINPTSVITTIGGQTSINLLDLISDSDDNLVPSSLSVIVQPASGATTTITNSILLIDYSGTNFTGTDQLTIQVCDVFGECVQQQVEIKVIGELVIYNAVSPNGDFKNEIFRLEYIDLIPETQNNKVTIYNRWGSKVFEVKNYNNDDRAFKGLNDNGNELPSGTYFYKIAFDSGKKSESGYLVLKR
jgi:gliding motility-associated-like protein